MICFLLNHLDMYYNCSTKRWGPHKPRCEKVAFGHVGCNVGLLKGLLWAYIPNPDVRKCVGFTIRLYREGCHQIEIYRMWIKCHLTVLVKNRSVLHDQQTNFRYTIRPDKWDWLLLSAIYQFVGGGCSVASRTWALSPGSGAIICHSEDHVGPLMEGLNVAC